ncbi:beta-lactamase/transpeptidase-like protein [Mollisia scopiformis]|uniref:Beta-lactamase/transpeptidase-like protein n=1 Tax=Mollisia scopiformis TaxID=149040 RepID=A0A194X4E6_MOLSC|nr:beta-lactamase/transpeptidase-like protein [Mollisia scopiformis]KUJ15053.1 beta-lactamase/transpeptidase-like protein [Mollisia scopiformis]
MSQRVAANIVAQEPLISRIREISAAPCLSVGVLHNGETVYTGHFGAIDTTSSIKPNDETIHFIASMSKAMVSALVGIFVEEGLLKFTTKAYSVLPELEKAFGNTGSKLTIADLLSHRVGISRSDALWLQCGGNELMPKSAALGTFVVQPAVRDFRTDFMYNNYCYGIVDLVLEKLTGKSLEENMQEKIFKPLGMTRTTFEPWIADDNFSRAHFPLQNGTSFEIPLPSISSKTINGASAGLPTILKAHNQLDYVSLREQSYALGWARAQLPCILGRINYNKSLVAKMPMVGEGAPSKLVLYHGGSLQGIGSAVYMLPESNSVIFAMQNSTGFCDACDWVPQLLIETIFGAANPVDFQALAIEAAAMGKTLADKVETQLQEGRQTGTTARDLYTYTGVYGNPSDTFHINIQVEDGKLSMTFQDIPSETYELRHYHHNEFVWNESFNGTARRGRFQTRPTVSYKIQFGSQSSEGDDRPIEFLKWHYDEYLAEPVLFRKIATVAR